MGATLSSAYSSQGACTVNSFILPALSCQFDALASGTSVTVTVSGDTLITAPEPVALVIIEPGPEPLRPAPRPPIVSIVNAGFSVTSAVNDPNPANNQATVVTRVSNR